MSQMKINGATAGFWIFYTLLALLMLFLVINVEEKSAWASIYQGLIVFSYVVFFMMGMKVFGKDVVPITLDGHDRAKLLIGIAAGWGLGLLMTGNILFGRNFFSLLTPLNAPLLTVFGLGTIFLTSVSVATVEEVMFRGLLFPLLRRVMENRYMTIAAFVGLGMIFVFMTEIKWVGWALVGLGILVYLFQQFGGLLYAKKNEVILAAILVSSAFALFHVNTYASNVKADLQNQGTFTEQAYNDALLQSLGMAFFFSLVAVGMAYAFNSLTPALIAHTLNNAILLSAIYNVPTVYAIAVGGLYSGMLFMLQTAKVNGK